MSLGWTNSGPPMPASSLSLEPVAPMLDQNAGLQRRTPGEPTIDPEPALRAEASVDTAEDLGTTAHDHYDSSPMRCSTGRRHGV